MVRSWRARYIFILKITLLYAATNLGQSIHSMYGSNPYLKRPWYNSYASNTPNYQNPYYYKHYGQQRYYDSLPPMPYNYPKMHAPGMQPNTMYRSPMHQVGSYNSDFRDIRYRTHEGSMVESLRNVGNTVRELAILGKEFSETLTALSNALGGEFFLGNGFGGDSSSGNMNGSPLSSDSMNGNPISSGTMNESPPSSGSIDKHLPLPGGMNKIPPLPGSMNGNPPPPDSMNQNPPTPGSMNENPPPPGSMNGDLLASDDMNGNHPPSAFTPPDICLHPQARGPCLASFERYYFNTSSKQCEKFIYGGCPGNANNFLMKEECESVCMGNKGNPLKNDAGFDVEKFVQQVQSHA